jgi:UDP-N-acetylglucosamine acyltransferase
VTRIGSDVFLMAYCHVAHDNVLEDHVVVANSAQIAGHVSLGPWAIVGGSSAIHQFVRIGAHAFLGGGSVVVMDVAPFCMATGNRAALHGLNLVGLRRRGFSPDEIRLVRRAYRLVFRSNLLLTEAVMRIEQELLPECPKLEPFCAFLKSSSRGLTR